MKINIAPSDVHELRQIPVKKNKVYINFINDLKYRKHQNIAVLCCPDYSFKFTRNGWAEYDHKAVGYGPGMLCLAYTTALMEIIQAAIKHNSSLNIYLFYGNNEADDKEILDKIGLDKNEFIHRIMCNQISGFQHYGNLIDELFGENAKYINLKYFGMAETFYTEKNLNVAENKLRSITQGELNKVMIDRKPVLVSLYGRQYLREPDFLLNKAKEQIFDRLVLGTYFDDQITSGKSWYILSISANILVPYFNFQNLNLVPIFNLGTATFR